MAVGVIVATLVRDATVLLGVLAVMGAFWALVNINSLPMVYDLAKSGSIGAYTGLYYFASSLAAIVGPTVAGGLIDLTNHRVIWPFTAVFLLLALFFMSRVRLQVRPG
jgi:maltose/moltooligosaccharide transporter